MPRTVPVLLALTFAIVLTPVFPGFAKEMSPVYEPIDPYLATPAPGHLYEIPVVVMRFLPTADGENLDTAKVPDYWSLGHISLSAMKARIDTFDKRIKFMLEAGSRFRGYKDPAARPSLGYRVVAYITVYEHTPPGPVTARQKDGGPLYSPDFHQIFDRFNMEHYVNDLGVKEIWVWMGGGNADFPSYDPTVNKPEDFRHWWESNMSSPLTGDISNSNRDNSDLPLYNTTYTVYGQNIWRTQAEAIHNHGHQLEAILSHVNHLQYGNTDLFWKKFVGQDAGGDFITGRAGWTHMPPNTLNHYDYTGTHTRVKSDIEDWTPDNSGAHAWVNVDTYGTLTYPWPDPDPAAIPQRVESQWYLYWMQSMPGHKNRIRYKNKNMTNWWVFTADWDAAIASQMGLVSQTATELPHLRDPDGGAKKPVDLTAEALSLLPGLKSSASETETAIIFENRTGAEVAYYWIDHKGNAIFYGNLAADASVKQSTYAGHFWLIQDRHRRNLAVFRAVAKTGRAVLLPALMPPIVHLGPAQRPPMYWINTETGTLHRLVGDGIEHIAIGVRHAVSVAVDAANGKIYWAEKHSDRSGSIRRAALNGSHVETVKALTSVPLDIAVDTTHGKIYISQSWGKIQSCNVDGSDFKFDLITGLPAPNPIALDVPGGKVYWTENDGRIRRAAVNGDNRETFAHNLGELGSIAIADGTLYFIERPADAQHWQLRRSLLNGRTRPQTLVTLRGRPTGLAVDLAGGKVYWTNADGKIQCANLNGGDIQTLVTGLPTPTHIALNPTADDTVPLFDDPFEGDALQNPNWQWQHAPTDWDVGETRKGFLHIAAETHRDLWITDASHLLYQETDADVFDVETHFFTRWDTFSGVNGLIVKSPTDNDWVTLKFWARDAGARGHIQYQASGRGLAADPAWHPGFGETELFFRLRKEGNIYTGWYKTRETDPWLKIGTAHVALTPPLHIGIYAGVAASTGNLTVAYAYFRRTVNTAELAAPAFNAPAVVIPTETALFPNYPNPFNPETWIPYQLAAPSVVKITIYDTRGRVVRHLHFGHQPAGTYVGSGRAAYWDGRNAVGERVASGLYLYTLTAGDFSATQKLLIRK